MYLFPIAFDVALNKPCFVLLSPAESDSYSQPRMIYWYVCAIRVLHSHGIVL